MRNLNKRTENQHPVQKIYDMFVIASKTSYFLQFSLSIFHFHFQFRIFEILCFLNFRETGVKKMNKNQSWFLKFSETGRLGGIIFENWILSKILSLKTKTRKRIWNVTKCYLGVIYNNFNNPFYRISSLEFLYRT